ncbi:MAG: hypothetical protein ACYTF8_06205 [Planctomycetota bacterium]|jgi:hypothetical protein
MPEGAVPRVLEYVGLLFLLCLASTFAWWAAANVARTEYRRLLSALACSMRIFFYSVCLLAILVAARSLHLAPEHPQSTLFGWIHLAGTVWITIPSAWRAFRVRRARLALVVAVGWLLSAGAGAAAALASPDFALKMGSLPRYLTSA